MCCMFYERQNHWFKKNLFTGLRSQLFEISYEWLCMTNSGINFFVTLRPLWISWRFFDRSHNCPTISILWHTVFIYLCVNLIFFCKCLNSKKGIAGPFFKFFVLKCPFLRTFHKSSVKFPHFTPKTLGSLQTPGSNSKTLGAATPPSPMSLYVGGKSIIASKPL